MRDHRDSDRGGLLGGASGQASAGGLFHRKNYTSELGAFAKKTGTGLAGRQDSIWVDRKWANRRVASSRNCSSCRSASRPPIVVEHGNRPTLATSRTIPRNHRGRVTAVIKSVARAKGEPASGADFRPLQGRRNRTDATTREK